MKKILLYIPAFLLLFSLQSKTQKQAWTLEECINYVIENNITLKQIELEQQDQEVLLNTSRNSWLPNLNANVGQDFNFGRTITEDNTYDNINTASTQAYLSLNMPVFDGFKIQNDIAARKLDLLASIENLSKAKEDLAMNVTSYYVTVLFNKEILHIAELQVILSQEQVEWTEVLVNTGKVPLSQLYDIKAQLADNEVTLAEARNNISLSLLDLVQVLELERSGGNFNIIEPSTENVIEKYMGSLLPPDDIFDYAVTFKPQIKAQEYLLEGQKKNLKIAQSSYYPQLSLNASWGSRYYHAYGDEYPNESFGNSIKNNESKGIGLSLSIPIFNRFQVRNSVRRARLGILNQELEIDKTKKTLYKEIQTAYFNATAAQEKYIASEKSVEATQEAFKYAEERYSAGKSTAYEFNEAKTNYAKSLSELAQAKYNFIFCAKILDFYNGIPITL